MKVTKENIVELILEDNNLFIEDINQHSDAVVEEMDAGDEND